MNLLSGYFHKIIINNQLLVDRAAEAQRKEKNITCPQIRKAGFDCWYQKWNHVQIMNLFSLAFWNCFKD